MKISDFKVLSFDTFGTLIDWETGILDSLSPLLSRLETPPPGSDVLRRFGELESQLEDQCPDMLYSEILESIYLSLSAEWQLRESVAEAEAFGQCVGQWPAFDDSIDALNYLRDHFKLVTLTNCDRANYSGAAARLGYPWDAIHTAEEIGCYKPSLINFDYMFREVEMEFGFGRQDILHVAQSLFHDHVPAAKAGLASAWIRRGSGRQGGGATPPPEGELNLAFDFEDMAELVAAHQAEIAA